MIHFDRGNDPCAANARYHCSVCKRPFDRKDTLARHMRIHDPKRARPKPRRKSCIPCARSKIKCLGEQPCCSSCRKRNTPCCYEHVQTTRRSPVPPLTTATQDPQMLLPGDSGSMRPTPLFSEQDFGAADPDFFTGSLSSGANETPGYNVADYLYEGIYFPWNLDWTFSPPPFRDASIEMPNLHHLFNPAPSNSAVTRPPSGSSTPAQTPASIADGLRLPALPELPTASPNERCGAEDSWPIKWHASPMESRFILPPLWHDDEDVHVPLRFFTIAPISPSTRRNLRDYLKLLAKRWPWQTLDLHNWPPEDQLDTCIDLYFAHFHANTPIIHQATFDPTKDPAVTLAMICIGALYTESPGALAFSDALSELIRRLLGFMAEYDHRFVQTEGYLTAQLLQGISGYCTRNERLFELSESFHGTMVHNAKCIGLFRDEIQPAVLSPATVQTVWHDWIQQERRCRLGWAIYEYDAAVAYLHNKRPCLTTGDINLPLPSSDRDWAAESAQMWASLHPGGNQSSSRRCIRPLMRSLFDDTLNPRENFKEERHLFLVIITLTSMVWSCKEIRSSAISDLVPGDLDEGRAQLLMALDKFYQCPASFTETCTESETARIVHRLYLIHLANLYGAGDLMSLLYSYVRNGPDSESARTGLAAWAAVDAARVRRVAHHCAQMLALGRIHANNSPLEPFVVFNAGVVLSCVAEFLPQLSCAACPTTSIRLDVFGMGVSQPAPISAWIREGGHVNISLHGVPSLCCRRGRRQVLNETAELLKRKRVWGIAQNFTRVVLSFRNNIMTDEESHVYS